MQMTPSSAKTFSWSYVHLPLIVMVVLLFVLFKRSQITVHDSPVKKIRLAEIEATLNEFIPSSLHSAGVPGLSMAIVKGKNIIGSFHYGEMHSVWGTAVDSTTVFEAASLSKPITAWAMLRLAQSKNRNIDSTIVDEDGSFTIRQLLNHSAGFDNQLGKPTKQAKTAGEFSYSGQGYVKLGMIMSDITEMPYQQYMNDVVLKELGMDNSYFGDRQDRSLEAKPHISVTMPQVMAATFIVFFTLLLTFVLWAVQLFRKRKILRQHQRIILIVSIAVSLFAPFLVLGLSNGIRFALVNALTILLVLTLVRSIRTWSSIATKGVRTIWLTVGLLSGVVLIYSMWIRPPVPLKLRHANFLPAAGLRTTSQDYAKFIVAIINQPEGPLQAQMTKPSVEASDSNDWGLGVGIQKEDKAIWHWGVNYPGFQSFFVAHPDRGDGVVVFMNGGPMSLTMDNPRFGGLELARKITAITLGGYHDDYWQQIN